MKEVAIHSTTTVFPLPARLPFVGDHLALNFLNSVAAPRGENIEELENGGALLSWLLAAGAIEPADIDRLKAGCGAEELDGVAKCARDIRGWFRTVLERLKDSSVRDLSDEILSKLNPLLLLAGVHEIIDKSGSDGRLTIINRRDLAHASALLMPIASAMANLVCMENLELVRRCENPICTMWFLDRTKGHRRRWCSQAVCGNRAKVAAFRARGRSTLPNDQTL